MATAFKQFGTISCPYDLFSSDLLEEGFLDVFKLCRAD